MGGANPNLGGANNAYASDPMFTTPLAFNGTGYLASRGTISDFPSVDVSISMWVRTTDVSRPGTLMSFTAQSSSPAGPNPYYEFAVVDQRSLRVVVKDHVDFTWRHPAQETGVTLNDGMWHHLVVTWSSKDGQVVVFRDGAKQFQIRGYRTGETILRQGIIMVGNTPLDTTVCERLQPFNAPCQVLPDTGFIGAVQNIRIYTEILGPEGAINDFQWPFTGEANLQLKVYWRSVVSTFSNGVSNVTLNNLATGNIRRQTKNEREAHHGVTSLQGIYPLETSSIRVPCVEDDVWYFEAPVAFLRKLGPGMYNGRLQFQLLAPSTSGYPRSRNGMVTITSSGGVRLTNAVSGFSAPSSAKWTSYSISLREDQGWSYYGTGEAVSFKKFREVLENVTSLSIRGDDNVCSDTGEGQEAVYIQNVMLFT